MLQMGETIGPRYTAPKISAISYLFRTFSLLIMGDTERPRYTGFCGLSVRGITALQCTFTGFWQIKLGFQNNWEITEIIFFFNTKEKIYCDHKCLRG